MNKINYKKVLKEYTSFSTNDFICEFKKTYPRFSESYAKKTLYKHIKNNQIARIGRNKYIFLDDNILNIYSYKLSKAAEEIEEKIKNNFPDLKFKIFELIQLNEFINHQIAQNVIFIYVEEVLGDFVFDLLKKEYIHKILIKPSLKDIDNYLVDNLIIIDNLTTEAPNHKNKNTLVCIEQIIVDLFSNKYVRAVINVNEIPDVINLITKMYVIDKSKMFRYARRRTVEKDLLKLINK
ncbi:MAG: DUF6577 family protein [Pleomorphochaeta sp.]